VTELFITSKLIYLELQKTACTHIAILLKRHVGGEKEGKHNWLTNYETEKKIIGSIRNPWTWYVSLWAYGCMKKGGLYTRLTKRNFLIILKDIARFRFYNAWSELTKPTKLWRNFYESSENAENFRNWLKLMFEERRMPDLREGYSDSSISNFAGFLTFRYAKLHIKNFYKRSVNSNINDYSELVNFDETNNILDDVIYLENLEKDFIRVVEKAGHSLANEVKEELIKKTERKMNVSKHHGASFYYDEDTKNLIQEKERFIIEKYNYSFPED
jgi:hypothetical protein